MILSVSRRTDIPAFYMEWFINRLKDEYCLVRNPMNPMQVSRVPLDRSSIEFIVFWTKNPKNLLKYQKLLEGHSYYVQVTINPYDQSIEKGVPKKSEIMNDFIRLANQIGPNRMIWRYDPILFTDKIDLDYHVKYFEVMAKKLSGSTNRCIFSFLSMYKKTRRNMSEITILEVNLEERKRLVDKMKTIATKYGIELQVCSDNGEYGVSKSRCIDGDVIASLLEVDIKQVKDKHQRSECGCVESIDIGAYDTCPHQCYYCYANNNLEVARKNYLDHDPNSPLLFGHLLGNESMTNRKISQVKVNKQLSLF